MEETLIQMLEEACKGILDKKFRPGDISYLRVKKADLSLEIDVIVDRKQLYKEDIKNVLAEKLKSKLAVPVKIKVNLL